ncbi:MULTISPECIES: hypothetical protein [Halobacterium]|uniref:hypothetical protein n=1 Tax=Halobacterium TaxID=2239 RepID=UPI001964D998|nr:MULTISPECIES: hypothetical protein [Halobacterium]MCF2164869.1 hypothetical protein [Halobacterium salinarum]MCF2168506.1 hypothetical protein [Halobacterium salinarum]MCF2238862.1 hypothetical protein [Halobacterium salinarum]MDL0123324.1 hypothetical protein [Halobacterium salinarum]MDL0128404.1 hypothetical protein [Halobacterium salinarum]
MSDTDHAQQPTDTDGNTTTTNTSDATGSGRHTRARDDTSDVRRLILRGALAVLGFVAIVALFQFYTSTTAVINEWVGREYRALFRAAFNLVILLATGIGISLVVRKLTGDGNDSREHR